MSTLLALFTSVSLQYNLPPGLLQALCYVESKHDAKAYAHNDGGSPSYGVCQIKYETAEWLGFKGTPEQLMEPKYNVKYAAKFLRYQLDRYGSTERAVIAYNMGHARRLTTTMYQARVFKQWRADVAK